MLGIFDASIVQVAGVSCDGAVCHQAGQQSLLFLEDHQIVIGQSSFQGCSRAQHFFEH